MKLNERGRGKYRPLKEYNSNEVKNLLFEKIEEEQNEIYNVKSELKIPKMNYKKDKLNLVSLFSGCGGLDLGVELAGIDAIHGSIETSSLFRQKNSFKEIREDSIFNTIYSVDSFKEANITYKNNFSDNVFQDERDIRRIKDFPSCDIVLGGFPCPGFSNAGPRLIDDKRNFLYIHFIRCLIQTKPAFFIAENVKGMLTLGNGEVIKQIIQDFESAGYKVKYKLVNARDYGVPQLRERVFIVGVRKDIEFEYEFPTATHGPNPNQLDYVTLKEAIGDLEEDPGEWYDGSYSSIYLSRNRKKKWQEQSFTIQASGRQAPLHPSGEPMKKIGPDNWILPGTENQHRRLSIKEVARIQTFPDWFEFSGGSNEISKSGRLNKIYKQIGNAVPVQLARAIARPIADWSKENYHIIEDSRKNFQLELF